MVVKKQLTVALYFSVEFEVEATGEPEAILMAAPNIQKLERLMEEEGYNFQMETARVRRPRSQVKAAEREEKRRDGQG